VAGRLALATTLLAPLGYAYRLRFDLDMPQPLVRSLAASVKAFLADGDRLALLLPGDNSSVATMISGVLTETAPAAGGSICCAAIPPTQRPSTRRPAGLSPRPGIVRARRLGGICRRTRRFCCAGSKRLAPAGGLALSAAGGRASMAADPLLGPALPAILAFGTLVPESRDKRVFRRHNPPLRDENPISIIALGYNLQNRGSGIQRGFRGVGRGLAAEFAPSRWFDFSAWKTRFTINNIARI